MPASNVTSLMDEGPGWRRGASVIRSSGLRLQILATAANRMGHLVTEGKISLPVKLCTTFDDGFLASTGQLVEEGPGWRRGPQ